MRRTDGYCATCSLHPSLPAGQTVETLPITERDAFRLDLLLARQASAHAVGPQCTKSKENTWDLWLEFCSTLKVDPLLNDVKDVIPYFQVFGARFRNGRLAPSGNPI